LKQMGTTMQARELWDGTIAVSGRAATLVFDRICAGIGWPDAEDGALCAVGYSPAGTYHVLEERRGTLLDLGRAVRAMKTDLLVDCFFVDGSDEISTGYLRCLEGAAEACRRDASAGQAQSAFRAVTSGHGTRDPIVIAAVRSRYREHFRGALESVRGIIASERLMVHRSECPTLTSALHRPLDYMITSPVIRALVWVVTAMEAAADDASAHTGLRDGWYVSYFKEIP